MPAAGPVPVGLTRSFSFAARGPANGATRGGAATTGRPVPFVCSAAGARATSAPGSGDRSESETNEKLREKDGVTRVGAGGRRRAPHRCPGAGRPVEPAHARPAARQVPVAALPPPGAAPVGAVRAGADTWRRLAEEKEGAGPPPEAPRLGDLWHPLRPLIPPNRSQLRRVAGPTRRTTTRP